jgi:hypothetical protein
VLPPTVLCRRGAMPEEDERTEHVRFINNYERDTRSGLEKSVFICTVTITIDNYCSFFGQNLSVVKRATVPAPARGTQCGLVSTEGSSARAN